MAEELGRLNAGNAPISRWMFSKIIAYRFLDNFENVTIVSHPVQKMMYMRHSDTHVILRMEVDSSEKKPGSQWIETFDMPQNEIHLETPKGRVVIFNLAWEEL